MDMNFDDFLKRAMESEMKDEPEEESDEKKIESGLRGMMGIIGMGSLVKLSKVANERIITVIKELKEDLNASNEETSAGRATLVNKIGRAAKTIDVLNTIIAASAITGSATLGGSDSEKDMEKSLDLIIHFALMH